MGKDKTEKNLFKILRSDVTKLDGRVLFIVTALLAVLALVMCAMDLAERRWSEAIVAVGFSTVMILLDVRYKLKKNTNHLAIGKERMRSVWKKSP